MKLCPERWTDLLRPVEFLRMLVIVLIGAYLLAGALMVYTCAVRP